MNVIRDLRDYIKVSEDLGVLKKIEGAAPELEIGALSDVYRRRKSTLFDKIKGFPAGHRVFSNIFAARRTSSSSSIIKILPPSFTLVFI